MPVPLTLIAPAVVAAGAYASARWQLGNDLSMLKVVIAHNANVKKVEKNKAANIFYALEARAKDKKDANKVMLWYDNQTWTFKQAYDISVKYGTWLKNEHGIASKDIVALDFTNTPKFLWTILGLWAIGARPALINFNLADKPLIHCIKVSDAKIVIVDDEVAQNFTPALRKVLGQHDFRQAGGSVKVSIIDSPTEMQIASLQGVREPDSCRAYAGMVEGDKLAALIYTSGTTGNPKPAAIPWGKFYAAGAFAFHWMGMNRNDVYYTCMPMYHATATVMAVIPAIIYGYTIAIGHKFSNKTFWPEVRASNATIIQYVGETCRYLLAAPSQTDPTNGANLDKVHKVRMAFGNGLRPDVWDKFKDRFGIATIAEFYSASEGAGALWNRSSNSLTKGAIGRAGGLIRALFGGSSEIVEVDWATELPSRNPKNNNFCTRAQIGAPGELLFKLDPADIKASYQGYYGNEKASESKILRNVFVKDDAYFRTGDTVRRDDEGRIYFVDRIGDTYRWRSENVSTNEVSEALGHHPSIEEANVYGVAIPHHDGNAGCAAITLQGGQEPSEGLLQELAVHAQNSLPKYAVPTFLRLSKQMATTGNNKQQKHGLRLQGVDPSKVDAQDKLFWLQNGSYRTFGTKEWQRLNAGQVKL